MTNQITFPDKNELPTVSRSLIFPGSLSVSLNHKSIPNPSPEFHLLKQEQVLPVISDRLSYPDWIKQGKKDIVTRAKEKYQEILATHQPTPLSDEQNEKIDQFLKEAKADFQSRGLL